jgi:hypothetical protein
MLIKCSLKVNFGCIDDCLTNGYNGRETCSNTITTGTDVEKNVWLATAQAYVLRILGS